MGAKGKKQRDSKDSTGSHTGSGDGEDKKKTDENGKGNGEGGGKSSSMGCDIFNDAAMENAYYVCHNVQDVLKTRGFAWPDAQKKKKKGKR